MTRYAGVLSSLLLTALLLYLMPGLVAGRLADTGRTDDRLKMPESRTLVVWITSWQQEDRQLISGLCSAFEKQTPGLRIYLRRADASELYEENAVLPDVVLHSTGDILSPETVLGLMTVPEGYPESAARAGRWQGRQQALPLWYAPNVLSLPAGWLMEDKTQTTDGGQSAQADTPSAQPDTPPALLTPAVREPAYFGTPDGAPDGEIPALTAENLPWPKLLGAGRLVAEEAVGLSQLMLLCPNTLRQELSRLTISTPEEGAECAVIRSLSSHLAAPEGRAAMAMPAVTSQRVRYVSLCKTGEDGAAFIRFLLGSEAAEAAMEAGLAPVCCAEAEGAQDPLLSQTLTLAGSGLMLPGAFLMGIGELESLCRQDFASGADPVATLLKLR